jgi:hypothetical protein
MMGLVHLGFAFRRGSTMILSMKSSITVAMLYTPPSRRRRLAESLCGYWYILLLPPWVKKGS